jgi:hypothetical protein
MLTFSVMGIKCIINLKNGVYKMGMDSATGKSFIVSLLCKADYVGVIKSVTYNRDSYMKHESLSNILSSIDDSIQIVVLDDIDFYAGEVTDKIVEQLRNIAEHAVVLLDSKYGPVSLADFQKYVMIDLRKSEIEVS